MNTSVVWRYCINFTVSVPQKNIHLWGSSLIYWSPEILKYIRGLVCLCCMDVVTFPTHTQAAFSQIMSSLCNSLMPQTCSVCQAEGKNKEWSAFLRASSTEHQDFYHRHDEWVELHELMTDKGRRKEKERSTEKRACCSRGVVNWISWARKQGRDALRQCQRSDRTEGELSRRVTQQRRQEFLPVL